MSNAEPQLTELHAHQLTVDPTMQRPLVGAQLAQMSGARYRRDALGTLTVSMRLDGTLIILDGQHRWHVAKLYDVAGEKTPLNCMVFTGLTRAQEAQKFLDANAQSPVSAHVKFLMAVEAGKPGAVEVQQVLDEVGILAGRGFGELPAITDAMRIASWPNGLELLGDALAILAEAWLNEGDDMMTLDRVLSNKPLKGVLLSGMARLLHRYGSEINTDRMRAALIAQGPRGPQVITTRATTLRSSMTKVNLDVAVAAILVEIYNSMAGRGRVEPWNYGVRDGLGRSRSIHSLLEGEVEEELVID